MKIIDCFVFYNELDLLEYRLAILYDVVDFFILVESTHTHIGKEKPLFYNINKPRFEKYSDKIIHIIVSDFPKKWPEIDYKNNKPYISFNGNRDDYLENGEQWINESFQRNCITRGIDILNYYTHKMRINDDDLFIISDLDEIPNPDIIIALKTGNEKVSLVYLEFYLYFYNLRTIIPEFWYSPFIISYSYLIHSNNTLSELRLLRNNMFIRNAGWHLSYFGDAGFIQNKYNNFAHIEVNNGVVKNVEFIENEMVSRAQTPIALNPHLPPLYEKYLQRFM